MLTCELIFTLSLIFLLLDYYLRVLSVLVALVETVVKSSQASMGGFEPPQGILKFNSMYELKP